MENEQVKKKYGAWKKATPKGEVINFSIEGKKYNMWINTYKKADNQPDYQIYEDNFKAIPQTSSKSIVNDDLEF
jgi:hypothetical protein